MAEVEPLRHLHGGKLYLLEEGGETRFAGVEYVSWHCEGCKGVTLVPKPSERELNEIRDAAFREGIEALKGELLHVDYHPQSTGVWHPYAYREWDGGYGKSL